MKFKSNNIKKGGSYVTNDYEKELQTLYIPGLL